MQSDGLVAFMHTAWHCAPAGVCSVIFTLKCGELYDVKQFTRASPPPYYTHTLAVWAAWSPVRDGWVH